MQFVPARHYKVDTHYKQPPFLLPSQNITIATPHWAFWTNRSRAQNAPFGPAEMSITLNHRQCSTRGGKRPPITAMMGKTLQILLVGTAGGHYLSGETQRHSKPPANHVIEHPLLPPGSSPDKCISSLLTSISNEPF